MTSVAAALSDTRARLIESWLAKHAGHGPGSLSIRTPSGEETVSCPCCARARVRVYINRRSCTVELEDLVSPRSWGAPAGRRDRELRRVRDDLTDETDRKIACGKPRRWRNRL